MHLGTIGNYIQKYIFDLNRFHMITGIHHFAIIVSSENSIAFYEKLGFKKSFQKVRENDIVILLEGYDICLEMYIDPSHPERSVNPERIGLRHLALKVDSCERISEQFDCGPIQKDWVGVNYCYTHDPDGLPIEFHE